MLINLALVWFPICNKQNHICMLSNVFLHDSQKLQILASTVNVVFCYDFYRTLFYKRNVKQALNEEDLSNYLVLKATT